MFYAMRHAIHAKFCEDVFRCSSSNKVLSVPNRGFVLSLSLYCVQQFSVTDVNKFVNNNCSNINGSCPICT
jgi:hypothetical protein